MSQYSSWSVVYNEQPSATKWNIISTNMDYFNNALPPVGGIVYYWGDSSAVPGYWMLADGSTVSDTESPINGLTIPDLRSKFIRGTTGNVRTTPVIAGSDTHSHTGLTGAHTLTLAEIPSHSHPFLHALTRADLTEPNPTGTATWSSAAYDTATDVAGGGGSHTHTISSDSNIPVYQGLVPIIRFK